MNAESSHPKKLFLSFPVLCTMIFVALTAVLSATSGASIGEPGEPVTTTQKAVKPSASSGSSSLYMMTGGGADTSAGDFVSPDGGLDTFYRYFIEVPAGVARLQVEIFDADVGDGGSAEATAGRDRARGDGFNSEVNYTLIDPAGVTRPVLFSSGDDNGPAGADNAWLTLFSVTGNNVRDNFGTASYNNNDGNNNWSAAWIETDAGGAGPSAGAIQITGGELRLQDNVSGTPAIQREADLLGTPGLNLSAAFLEFDFRTSNNLEDSDDINVEVSNNGGGSWTTLETFENDDSGSRSYNITAFIANNTRVRFIIDQGYNDANEFFFVDNLRINDGGTPTAGHWELRIDMSSDVTGGDDINAFGIRAHDGTSSGGGTELPVYVDSIATYGVNPPASGTNTRSYTVHPYITSGCSCSKNDFDYDSNEGNTGSLSFTSRTGAFTKNFASAMLSGEDAWRRDAITGWVSDAASSDYGIWNAGVTITSYTSGGQNGNYTNIYMGNFQVGANPPGGNPIANTFRVYLPTDAGTAPVKPHVSQFLSYVSGPNPTQVGQTTRFLINIIVMNPTAQAITFSTPTNILTANVPGAGVVYAGTPVISQGSLVSQPAVGGTGNVTWNPGVLAASASASLMYRVDVTPTSAGQRLPVTATPASGNGTRARWLDETGNASQTRASYLFGPLCELAVTQNVPTAVELASFTATAYDGGVYLEWKTGLEVDNLGFNIYRESKSGRAVINQETIAGSAFMIGPETPLRSGQAYGWWDKLSTGDQDGITYWLEDVDLKGVRTLHGPFKPKFVSGKPPAESQAALLSQITSREPRITTGLPAAQANRPSPGRPLTQNALASKAALKLSIGEEGWYRVTQPELIAAGLDAKVDPRNLQLYVEGQELAILVTGEQDGSLDLEDAVEFYGVGKDTPNTDVQIYWLAVGSQRGQRIQIKDGSGNPGGAQSFSYTVERKDRSIYFAALRNGDKENFFGSLIAAEPVTQALTLRNVDTSQASKAELEIALQGVTDLTGPAPDHVVKVSFNGTELTKLVFDGTTNHVERISLDGSLLKEGENIITFNAEAGASDISLVDSIRLTYQHIYAADQDYILMSAARGQDDVQTIDGFSSGSIRVIDVTDPASAIEIIGEIKQQKNIYSVTAAIQGGGTRRMLALTSDRVKRPISITANLPSSWRKTGAGADLIVITRPEFQPALEPLVALRRSQGLSVALIYFEDICDEFRFGERTPLAVKELLAYATSSWKRKPRYVLLAGDSSLDPKNYLGLGDQDLIPTRLTDTQVFETACDDWLADFNNDGLPELALGRLPFSSIIEAATMVSKIVAYDRAAPSEEVLLVADMNDGFDFERASDDVADLIPTNLRTNRINRGQIDTASARGQLFEALLRGQKIVNYVGHGSVGLWRGNLLTSEDAVTLSRANSPSLFVMMTCLNGFYHDPYGESLAESLMTVERGGAVAVWASSALTIPDEQAKMNRQFYSLLFATRATTLGEAVQKAKIAASDTDVRRTWLLFGDPTMRLR